MFASESLPHICYRNDSELATCTCVTLTAGAPTCHEADRLTVLQVFAHALIEIVIDGELEEAASARLVRSRPVAQLLYALRWK